MLKSGKMTDFLDHVQKTIVCDIMYDIINGSKSPYGLFVRSIEERLFMNIYNICISHKTSPVKVRELLAFTKDEKVNFLKAALEQKGVQECVLITTCNRTEVYIAGEEEAVEQIMVLISGLKNLSYSEILKYFLRYEGEKAVKHLFQVATGLDSMVVGEDEILGQVKEDYQLAFDTNTTDYMLNILFRHAITCAKKVKTDTKLSKTSVSIGTLTANEVFHFEGENDSKKVLIIGLAGKFGTIVMKNLYHNKKVEITGTIRSHNLPEEVRVVCPDVRMVDYKTRYMEINEADIIISATSSPHYTITYHELKQALTKKKKRLFIDLAVPMDIDKKVLQLEGHTLIDIDYFKQLAETNNHIKLKEAEAAKLIIEKQMDEFYKEINFRDFLPFMGSIKELVEKQSFEGVLYRIRNSATNKELEVILNSLKKLL
jgi:glutamyl-tRNA reductase